MTIHRSPKFLGFIGKRRLRIRFKKLFERRSILRRSTMNGMLSQPALPSRLAGAFSCASATSF